MNNNGALFNQSDSNHPSLLRLGAGGLWTGLSRFDTVVFGAGLWIGGLRNRSGILQPHSEFTYNPNRAQSEFEPGSLLYDGTATDTSQPARDKYRVYSSDDLVGPPWPIRTIHGKPGYVDDPTLRAAAGAKATLGDEDLFLIYKDSDPDSIDDPFGLEIRTTASFWRSGLLANVVFIHNEIIYSGRDTIYDPVVALAVDGDINNPEDDRMKGLQDESVSSSIFFTNNSATDPLLGVLGLSGQYRRDQAPTGITSLRYWDILEDPITDSERYSFLTAPEWDTALTVPGDARILMSSLSQTPLLPGDTLDFDYALYVEPPNGVALSSSDAATMLQTARAINSNYLTGELRPSSLVAATQATASVQAWPNPASNSIYLLNTSGAATLTLATLTLYDELGRKIMTSKSSGNTQYFDIRNTEQGVYFIRYGSQIIPVEIAH